MDFETQDLCKKLFVVHIKVMRYYRLNLPLISTFDGVEQVDSLLSARSKYKIDETFL